MVSPRGQAYTLEAVIAALIILSSLTFALQVTAVTPLTASTSNQHIENQQRSAANGALAAAADSGAMKDAVLYWDDDNRSYVEADRITYYTQDNPSNEFGAILNRTFAARGLAVNVQVYPEGGSSPLPMVYRGEPSDNAVSASRTVVLYDNDNLTAPGYEDVTLNATDATSAETFDRFIADEHPDSPLYNVVRVEVHVWRM